MAEAGFVAAAAGATSSAGVGIASCGGGAGLGAGTASGRAVARAVGAASGRQSCRDEKASVSTNAATTSPHKSNRLPTSASTKKL
jgi:hypothetical protein